MNIGGNLLNMYVDTTVVVRESTTRRERATQIQVHIGVRFIARGYPEKTKLKRHVV